MALGFSPRVEGSLIRCFSVNLSILCPFLVCIARRHVEGIFFAVDCVLMGQGMDHVCALQTDTVNMFLHL